MNLNQKLKFKNTQRHLYKGNNVIINDINISGSDSSDESDDDSNVLDESEDDSTENYSDENS